MNPILEIKEKKPRSEKQLATLAQARIKAAEMRSAKKLAKETVSEPEPEPEPVVEPEVVESNWESEPASYEPVVHEKKQKKKKLAKKKVQKVVYISESDQSDVEEEIVYVRKAKLKPPKVVKVKVAPVVEQFNPYANLTTLK